MATNISKPHLIWQSTSVRKEVTDAIPNLEKDVTAVAEVRLRPKTKDWSPKIHAIIDTGATISLFPKSWCDELGLRLEEGKRLPLTTHGTEQVYAHVHILDMKIGHVELNDMHIGFLEKEKGSSVIGRHEILSKFDARFNLRDDVVSFDFGREMTES